MSPLRRLLAVTAVAGVVGLGPAAAASAAPLDLVDDGQPGLLTIDAEPLSLQVDLEPGEFAEWFLTTMVDAERGADLSFQATRDGILALHPAGITLTLDECAVEWDRGSVPAQCGGARTTWMSARPFADIAVDEQVALGDTLQNDERFFRAVIALPDPVPNALQGVEAEFALGFLAAGDTETVVVDFGDPPGRPDLSVTGMLLAAPLALAVVLSALGVGMKAASRRGSGS